MTVGKTFQTISRNDIISKVSEADILGYYLKDVTSIPCLINSPLRTDNKPSFTLYTPNGKDILYKDFSTGESGTCMDLLMKYFSIDRSELYKKIQEDLLKMSTIECNKSNYKRRVPVKISSDVKLECEIREWRDYDIEYWNSYGVSIPALEYCNIFPISHKIITKNGKRSVFSCDKYAYVYIERKEGNLQLKFYQPFSKEYKWQTNIDASVIALWTKLPEKGNYVCICSSVKDALCLRCNMGIPAVALEGEGYPISNTAMHVLRKRFTDIYICLDNDETGLRMANKLSTEHSLINVIIPESANGKDISDVYKYNGKEFFMQLFKQIFKEAHDSYYNELPF